MASKIVEEAAFIPAVSATMLVGIYPKVNAEQYIRPADEIFPVTVRDLDVAVTSKGDDI